MSALDAALARLESGEPLPKEPGLFHLRDCGFITTEQMHRLWYAKDRIQARFNRDVCARFPVECQICGATFTRKRIDQKRCQECIDRAKPQRR